MDKAANAHFGPLVGLGALDLELALDSRSLAVRPEKALLEIHRVRGRDDDDLRMRYGAQRSIVRTTAGCSRIPRVALRISGRRCRLLLCCHDGVGRSAD